MNNSIKLERRNNLMVTTLKYLFSSILLSVPMIVSAGYLDASPNWKAPQEQPMSKRVALSVAAQCNHVENYVRKNKDSGAMLVAGPHISSTDNRLHLTLRLYEDNRHKATTHVYVNKLNNFTDCKLFPN